MGLDMYLYKKTYVKNWEFHKPGERHEVKVSKGGKQLDKSIINPEKVVYIIEDAGYWRKANAIHKWFVDNVQDGNDDCGSYCVSREQLENLLELVKQVLADHSKNEELLPTESGFFFGNTDYCDSYYSDLNDTKSILTEALTENGEEFEYHSSW